MSGTVKGASVLLVGGSGLLGASMLKSLQKHGYRVSSSYNTKKEEEMIHLDVTDREELRKVADALKPKLIIDTHSLLGRECEKDNEKAWKINVEGTRNLLVEAKKHNAKFVFISSDYVFDGEKRLYADLDVPSPLNYYGLTKAVAEELVRYLSVDHLVIRTSGIYGSRKGFARWVYDTMKKGQKVDAFTDQYVSPTLADNLAEIIIRLCEAGKPGTFNVASKDPVSKYQFAEAVCKRFRLDPDLLGKAESDGSMPTGSMVRLDSSAAEKQSGTHIYGLEEGLKLLEFD